MPNQHLLLPLWVRFASGQRLAGLNGLSPLYLRSKSIDYGGGDLGCLYELIDKAKEADFSVIQLLPLYDTGENPSPYMPVSFFAINPVFLWVDDPTFSNFGKDLRREQEKWAKSQIPQQIDYVTLRRFKLNFLKSVYQKLKLTSDFIHYKKVCKPHTIKYAQFCTLQQKYDKDWQTWDKNIVLSEKETDFFIFVQWILEKQLLKIKQYSEEKGIYLCFDKPLYLQAQSSDVWANQQLFYLQSDGYPRYVSGCNNPSDPFGGQVWGHPIFQFEEQEELVRKFFIKTVEYLSQFCHSIRLDHVLAMIWKYYLIDPYTGKGEYRLANSRQTLQEIIDTYPDIYFIAEDSGYESETEVDKPMETLGLSGIRCVQWETGRNQDTKTYPINTNIYSSTHDTLSLTGWRIRSENNAKRIFSTSKNNSTSNVFDFSSSVFDHLLQSRAQMVFVSILDLLFDTRRLNIPGTTDSNNWQIRMLRKVENIDMSTIKNMVSDTGRGNSTKTSLEPVIKPAFPCSRDFVFGDKLRLIIVSKTRIENFTIFSNLPTIGNGISWGTLKVDAKDCQCTDFGIVSVYYVGIPLAYKQKGVFELAVSAHFLGGNIQHLYEYGKNVIINIL